MEYGYLKEEYVEEIAEILVNKYKRARTQCDLLSDKYENIDFHKERIKKFIGDEQFIIGFKDEKIVGFMIAYQVDSYKGTAKGALVLPSMHGVVEEEDQNRVYEKLYKKVSEVWANTGCYTHSVLMYHSELDTLDTWFYNGFGLYVIDAVRPLTKIKTTKSFDNMIVREANEDDLKQLLPLIQRLNTHLTQPPIFLYDDGEDEVLESYRSWLQNEGNHIWVACKENEIIGYLKTNTHEINQDELNDGNTLGINGAFVLPQYRGNQIMSHLINHAMDWAIQHNLKRCSTDFETANDEGRHYWLKHFKPYSYALIRRIDERNYLK